MQLYRFLQNSKGREYEIRVAGYHGDLRDIDADYTLDSLFDFYGQDTSKPITGKNYQRYLEEVSIYKPDLIISDLEFFSTYAAIELGIPYWIVSSFAFYFAINKKLKDSLGIAKHHRSCLFDNKNFHRYKYQLDNADRKFIYSFLGDIQTCPDISSQYTWARPYHVTSNEKSAQTFVVSVSNTDKPFFKLISALGDTKLFSESEYETFGTTSIHQNIRSTNYARDLKNSYLVFSSGETSIIADALYNGKYSLIYPDYKSKESIVNGRLVEFYGLGEKIYTRRSFEQINSLVSKNLSVSLSLNKDVKYLHEYIKDLYD